MKSLVRRLFAALDTHNEAPSPKTAAALTIDLLAAFLAEAVVSGHPYQAAAEGMALVTVLMLRS